MRKEPGKLPQVLGKKRRSTRSFPGQYALDPSDIAIKLGERLIRGGPRDIKDHGGRAQAPQGHRPESAEAATRIPISVRAVPHNSSTVVPEGSRAYAGIVCHYMPTVWTAHRGVHPDGREGTNGSARHPSPKPPHVFQNLGDGTYIHLGQPAIRAARAAGVSMTFKILYNDAVARTAGSRSTAA